MISLKNSINVLRATFAGGLATIATLINTQTAYLKIMVVGQKFKLIKKGKNESKYNL